MLRTLIFCIGLVSSGLVMANQALYCKGDNYLAYERFNTDPYHLHVVHFSGAQPTLKRIKLPYKVTSKLGMNCRDTQIELQGRYHFVKIDLSDANHPVISKGRIKDKQRVSLPEHSFYKDSKDFNNPLSVLESGHSYHINVEQYQTNETYPTGANRVKHIKTELLVLGPNGRIENRKLLFTDLQWEPID